MYRQQKACETYLGGKQRVSLESHPDRTVWRVLCTTGEGPVSTEALGVWDHHRVKISVPRCILCPKGRGMHRGGTKVDRVWRPCPRMPPPPGGGGGSHSSVRIQAPWGPRAVSAGVPQTVCSLSGCPTQSVPPKVPTPAASTRRAIWRRSVWGGGGGVECWERPPPFDLGAERGPVRCTKTHHRPTPVPQGQRSAAVQRVCGFGRRSASQWVLESLTTACLTAEAIPLVKRGLPCPGWHDAMGLPLAAPLGQSPLTALPLDPFPPRGIGSGAHRPLITLCPSSPPRSIFPSLLPFPFPCHVVPTEPPDFPGFTAPCRVHTEEGN